MRKPSNNTNTTSLPPARSPEDREKQMINLAVNLAEKQLRDGTASAQVITHYLKLGTEREKLEREKLERENILLTAKTDAIRADSKDSHMYAEAIRAMMEYRGIENGPET